MVSSLLPALHRPETWSISSHNSLFPDYEIGVVVLVGTAWELATVASLGKLWSIERQASPVLDGRSDVVLWVSSGTGGLRGFRWVPNKWAGTDSLKVPKRTGTAQLLIEIRRLLSGPNLMKIMTKHSSRVLVFLPLKQKMFKRNGVLPCSPFLSLTVCLVMLLKLLLLFKKPKAN